MNDITFCAVPAVLAYKHKVAAETVQKIPSQWLQDYSYPIIQHKTDGGYTLTEQE